jgi:hypothetical protein
MCKFVFLLLKSVGLGTLNDVDREKDIELSYDDEDMYAYGNAKL